MFVKLNAQQDFNNYKSLKSQGEMPKDFSFLTSNKIRDELAVKHSNLSKSQEKIFLQGIYYGIDQLLHSGMVVYGDEISKYISEVSNNLLKNKYPELIHKLRFYTIKSNEVNALSTDQGIIFVTTGLISQLTNEAQLAFILAHEISHFTEKHVIESFEYKSNLSNHIEGIRQFSVYSKEKELEADKLGVELYYKAGYSKEDLISTFDVLMYSYLPFEEIEFPKNYFNNESFYIPEKLFPSKKYEIRAIENSDDLNSSHPNIKKRKSEIETELNSYEKWGSATNLFGIEKFFYVRNLSRFESIKTDIFDAQYVEAIYSIFILEKEFPNSFYLKKMKAHCWLGLAQYKNAGKLNETILKSNDLEGEVAAVHYFIKQLNNEAILTIALREIYKIKKQFPDNEEIDVLWNRTIKLGASSEKFDLNKFSDQTFESASKKFLKPNSHDSIFIKNEIAITKYDKIKNKKNNIDPTVFDSSKFYYYGSNELIKNDLFLLKYKHLKDSILKSLDYIQELENLPIKERKRIESNKKIHLSKLDEFILVEPSATSYKNGKIDYNSSEKLEVKYNDAINSISTDLGISIYTINSEKLNLLGTLGFNERSVLTNFLMQISHNDEFDILPVEYSELREIEKNYGTTKVIFTIIEHTYKPEFSFNALYLILYPPAFLGYIPIPFMKGNHTELNLLILDTKEAKIEKGFSYNFNEPINSYSLKARMYSIFKGIQID
jgi:predicted Zn-dependent protease